MQKKHNCFLFAISYLGTSALFSLREQVTFISFYQKLEHMWEMALFGTSRYLRK